MHKKSVTHLFLFPVLLLITSGLCNAQANASAQQSGKQKSNAAAKSTTVTGCLQKGDEANEYSISDNGKTYGLRSRKIDLSKHVGHQVSVTGTLRPEGREENEAKEANEKKEAGDIRVTNLKMIKDSCQ